MLKPEDARKQLTEIKAARPKVKALERCGALSAAQAEAFLDLWGLDKNGKQAHYWQGNEERQKHIDFLAKNPVARRQVMEVFFGPLAPHVEAAWQFFDKLPYTRGYGRRAFRAPTRPEASDQRRGDWLFALAGGLREFPAETLTPSWLAAWAVHLYTPHELGYLFASIIEEGGPVADDVLQILKDSSSNQHDIGGMGAHVCRALLCCARPDAWEFMGKLLLAAQRQEGLRQSILEAVDEAHPGAFTHMLKLIREEDLIRFSSVVRAAGVWLGQFFDALTPAKVRDALQAVQTLLEDRDARRKAIDKGTIQDCRTALWCYAFEDVTQLLELTPALLAHEDADRRLEMIRLLEQTGLPELMEMFVPLLDDADLRVVKTALDYFGVIPYYGGFAIESRYVPEKGMTEQTCRVALPADLFERMEKVIARLPENPVSLKMAETDVEPIKLSRAYPAGLLLNLLGERSPERLIPHFAAMEAGNQAHALLKLAAMTPLTPVIRDMLLQCANHANEYVRNKAVEALKKLPLAQEEIVRIESFLVRKTEKLRLSLFAILLNQTDDGVLATIERLLQASEVNQRLAGIELGRQMQVARRQREAIHARMVAYHESGRRLTKAEVDALKPLLVPPAQQYSLDDCLGLIDPRDRTPVVAPVKRDVQILSPAAAELLRDLDAFIHRARDKTFTVENHSGAKQEFVLGSAYYGFPRPTVGSTPEEDRKKLPLVELWDEWWDTRPDGTRDADGLELIRAWWQPLVEVRAGEEEGTGDGYGYGSGEDKDESAELLKKTLEALVGSKPVRVRYVGIIQSMLAWFVKLHLPRGTADFVLDALETIFAAVPAKLVAELPELINQQPPHVSGKPWRQDWRVNHHLGYWIGVARQRHGGPDWAAEHDARLYRLLHWLDQPIAEASRYRPEQHELLNAYAAKACTLADVFDDMIGPAGASSPYAYYSATPHRSLAAMTQAGKGFADRFEKHPEIKTALDRCVGRILEIELARGEAPTVATPLANAISSLHGADTLFRLLAALGNTGFSRKFESWSPLTGKAAVLTRLTRVTKPLPGDKPKDFTGRARESIQQGVFAQDMIVELGLLNPFWLNHAEETIGWPGYSEAVWWFIAHIPNPFDIREQEGGDEEYNKIARQWQAIVKARTDLTPEQRYEGIIDVAWFHRAYQTLDSAKRWDAIEEAAKFLQRGQSHKRAARLADVLLGKAKKKELVEGIRKKNLKEYVRLLGLLPLPEDTKKREGELQDRYKVLREYERYAKGLSSLSKEPAPRAVRLGLENLAVTAGLADPMRLEWHVTRAYVADLLKGPVAVKVKEVTVSLALNEQGEPDVTQVKAGKPLKNVPPDVKKTPKVAELFDRRTDLKRMAASTKLSLEMAMCRGDAFTGRELQDLMDHAIVRPLLERLVLQHDGAKGYPVKNGKALESHGGKTAPVKASDRITIAHPLDLLAGKDWHHWQKDCFARERLQPFKQIFREIYVATKDEEHEGDRSRRYAGHQLNPQQAMALFGQRGWSTREGIEKLYRDEGIIAEVHFNGGYNTPAEVEAPTLELVGFRKRDSWTLLALKKVPRKIFSEVMRDLDLVVSVAHVGGVDPEASASTVEMRGTLLRETFTLLAIKNVKLDSRHALIRGKLGSYSVHLGSGIVHKQPGGAVCIVPVHSQQRGRLFLPFADNDPKTAEVVSKVLLLARDHEIQDPTILQQIALR